MKTLIIQEKEELYGLRTPNQRQLGKSPKVCSSPDSPSQARHEVLGSFKNFTKNTLKRMTKKQIYHQMVGLKNEMEGYICGDAFEGSLGFGYFLNQYIRRQNKLDKHFAAEVGVTRAAISQYLNDHRKPTKEFLVRLELHSNNLIPAILWFRLTQKEKEHEIMTDAGIRKTESRHVKTRLCLPEKLFD
jgi:transcriptional regulator with XRE-family HTH domain